jgi:hypothetical protein
MWNDGLSSAVLGIMENFMLAGAFTFESPLENF